MNNRFLLFLICTAAFWTACSKIPSWVIPEKEMENLLYDIHLAEAEIENNHMTFRDSVRKQKLFHAVFEKHGVNREKFDTSLVWYASHLSSYLLIYKRINDRYGVLSDTLNSILKHQTELEAKARCLWKYDSIIVLRPFELDSRYVFHVDTSSYFSYGDMYELRCSVLGVNERFKPRVTLSWAEEDTVVVKHSEISSDGHFVLYLNALPGKKTSSLSGSIRVATGVPGTQLFIKDLSLFRHRAGYHPEAKELESAVLDSTKTIVLKESLKEPLIPQTKVQYKGQSK